MVSLNANLIKPLAKCNQSLISKGGLNIIGDNENALPLDLLLVIDMSGSMSGDGERIVQQSVIFILDNLMGPDDKVAIITFNNGANLHMNWGDKNSNPAAFSAGGGTNFGSAINETLSCLGAHGINPSRAGTVLFLSDGQGQKANDENVRTITEFGFTMHTIGVTSGANPTHLNQMAELARGFYFDAPGFDDVKKAFSSIFNYGKTVAYAAPDLKIKIEDGVTISDIVQSPQGVEIAKGPLSAGNHEVSLSHLVVGMRSDLTFRINVDNVACEDNLLATFECIGGSTELRVKGTTDDTQILNTSVNVDVTLMTKTGQAARLLKTGDKAGATRIITQIKTLEKTHPQASDVTKTLTDVSSKKNQGEILEGLGKLQTDKSGKTIRRED
tara:strand:- start:3470 stop:4627 length:1158 start_codon:yes stop_codon:yes gene_type:complete